MDREDFESWLKEQSRETCHKVTTRAALRVFPIVASSMQPDEARQKLTLATARAILTSAVAGVLPSSTVVGAAFAAAVSAADENQQSEDEAAQLAAQSAYAFTYAVRSVRRAEGAFHYAEQAANTAASAGDAVNDAAFADTGLNIATIFDARLWHQVGAPERLRQAPAITGGLLESSQFSFWREWYQGFLDGKPLDWELQKEIALIPDAEWEKGPQRITALIAEIRARFDLRARIADLEAELATATKSRLAIGGNNPPEPIEASPAIDRELAIIWAPLQDLKAETDSEQPDRAKIKLVIEALGKALKTGLRWCAQKADLAVDTTIVSTVKWAVGVGAGYLALNPDKITAVIDAAKMWLQTLF